MSSANNTLGTQSPPLDQAGQNEPMGVSNIAGDKHGAVPDSKQRQQYFEQSEGASPAQPTDTASQSEKTKTD